MLALFVIPGACGLAQAEASAQRARALAVVQDVGVSRKAPLLPLAPRPVLPDSSAGGEAEKTGLLREIGSSPRQTFMTERAVG